MTENIKRLLELASKDEALMTKLNGAPKEEFIAIAKGQGIALTEADFEASSGEIADDELNAVSGGAGISYFIDRGGQPVKIVIGDPDRNLKPFMRGSDVSMK